MRNGGYRPVGGMAPLLWAPAVTSFPHPAGADPWQEVLTQAETEVGFGKRVETIRNRKRRQEIAPCAKLGTTLASSFMDAIVDSCPSTIQSSMPMSIEDENPVVGTWRCSWRVTPISGGSRRAQKLYRSRSALGGNAVPLRAARIPTSSNPVSVQLPDRRPPPRD